MKMNFVRALVAVAAFAATVSDANAAYVQNGEFNNPWGGGSYTPYGTGGNFGGWNVDSGSVDLIGGYWQSATVGGGSVDLDGDSPGAISQSLTTGTGTYKLTFSLSANPDNGLSTKSVRVSVADIVQDFSYTLTGANNHGNMNYSVHSIVFNAVGAVSLAFASLSNSGPYGPVISGVSVSAVPLPAALPMFLTSLLGFAGLRRRKAKPA
jgi:choice-of-anchor C domain-containing protein